MVKRADGFWETTISVPITATALNICFTDGGTGWDTNGGGNWNQTVTAGSYFSFFNQPGTRDSNGGSNDN